MNAEAIMKAANAWAAKRMVADVLRPPGPLALRLEADASVRRGKAWADWLAGHRAFWTRGDSARAVEKP